MREIKFRGRDNNGVWYYGYINKYSFNGYTEASIRFSNESGSILIYQVKEETVGQYTGIKDKNGNEIYEGDILGDFIGLGVVKYNECTAGFVIDILGQINEITFGEINYNNYVLEVIGNIYENPDILDIIK